jgi:beta-glucosidase/6-phospho-beta-glucosidase/beta-galactosidase
MATLDGYAVEGGFDRRGEPATCFAATVALGRHAGPGDACQLWRDYEVIVDLAATLRLDGLRLDVEWARVEPRRGAVDIAALARYRVVAQRARAAGLATSVVLVDAAWPAWLGQEAWLLPWVEPRVIEHARRVVDVLGDAIDGVVVFADAPGVIARGFLEGTAPPWRRRAREDAASAATQVARVEAALGDDDVVGPLVVRRHRTVALDAGVDEVAAAVASEDCDEVYLRSLVRGAGPSASSMGLLARHEGVWRVEVPEDLGDLLT